MAPRTVYASLPDGLANLSLWDQSLADMGSIGVIPCTASGTNAIVLTPIASLFSPNINNPPNANQMFSFVATATSTGSVTVQIANITAFLKLYRMDAATQAGSGDVQQNVTYVVSFGSALNSNAGGFQIQSPISNEINPIITGATISNSTLSGCTITTSTYNGNTWTAGTGTLTLAAAKTLTASNSLTLAGTDGTTMTFPTTNATIARTDTGQTFSGTQAFGTLTATTFNGNTLTAGSWTLNGVAAKTLTFNNSLTLAGTDGTTITFQGTDTYVGRATTDTLTNKTFDTAGAGNVFKINGTQITANTGTGSNVLATSPALTTPNIGAATATSVAFSPTTGGLVGTTAADSASAGTVGEVISSTVASGSAVSLTTGTAKTVTSISLTAGDWDVMGQVYFSTGGTTTVTLAQAGINTTTNAFPAAPDTTVGYVGWQVAGGGAVTGSTQPITTGVFRQNVSTTTTVYLIAFSNFGTSTQAAYGSIWARRRR